jgi:cell division protein FtsL|tara:strand:- start:332 stop:523 length:192 start_codon:yes stop_codon:yes gene_type:complete
MNTRDIIFGICYTVFIVLVVSSYFLYLDIQEQLYNIQTEIDYLIQTVEMLEWELYVPDIQPEI